ncbi:hypothetical protein chiPu_0005636 [Chiloscyllium punctatum]|uniref:Dynein heavy chain tail domain-containing protein n=1 Tax=Chiloscyllium punctatum TaxID=137246 RepID=A0A401S9X9_CHIPU|nr:hypothetical protein [Chiloscyllium punctatum]
MMRCSQPLVVPARPLFLLFPPLPRIHLEPFAAASRVNCVSPHSCFLIAHKSQHLLSLVQVRIVAYIQNIEKPARNVKNTNLVGRLFTPICFPFLLSVKADAMTEEKVNSNFPIVRAEDERIDFIKEQAFKSLKVKSEKWNKFIAVDENKKLLLDFFDEMRNGRLLFFTGAGGALHADSQLTFTSKSKMLYIFKNCSGNLSDNDHVNELMLGEILQHPVEHLAVLINEVLVPILSNSNNHLGWPQAISYDVRKHTEMIKSRISVVHGQMEGKTILPLPLVPESVYENQEIEIHDNLSQLDKSILHSIESMVIQWMHQITDVMKQDSVDDLFEEINPTPSSEIYFWMARKENLLGIYKQALNYLVPEEIFKVETEEALEKVQLAIHILESFKNCFHQHRLKISQYYSNTVEVKHWDFPTQMVFARFDRFFACLLKIEELFNSAMDFFKLERIEIGGFKGKAFSEIIYGINEEFQECWRVFGESKYDPLDYNNKEFLSDHSKFMNQLLDFDKRLGSVLNLAFQNSGSLESAFKVLIVHCCG